MTSSVCRPEPPNAAAFGLGMLTGQIPPKFHQREVSEPAYGACFAKNSLTRAFASVRVGSVFHSGMNSQFGSSFESSSEIGQGCASSLPAKTMHGVRIVFTKSPSAP